MTGRTGPLHIVGLDRDYADALVASGLVDDVRDPARLRPSPYRFAEGEFICRHGDPASCLWVVVDGSIAVRDRDRTLFVRKRNEVVGEQHLVGNGYARTYDLIANETSVEVLVVEKGAIETHPEADVIWRNIARILSIKLRNATRKTSSLSRQVADDTRILHAYTNEYALRRRMESGEGQAEYLVDRAIIWFSDVVDFSRHTLDMPPDSVADFVQRFFNAQSEPILESGGHIDKFIGDGLMAFWVLPKEGDVSGETVAAVRAADRAVKAVGSISIGGQALSLRIGLHIGLVLSGDFGSATRNQFTLIGKEVNKAARLEQIRSDDIRQGTGTVGAVRISPEFRCALGAAERKMFARKFLADKKNVGTTEFYTT